MLLYQGVTDDINPMDAIEEENTNSTEESDDECEEDLEETEFVPSAWDSQATPTKSALRSPEQSTKVILIFSLVAGKLNNFICSEKLPEKASGSKNKNTTVSMNIPENQKVLFRLQIFGDLFQIFPILQVSRKVFRVVELFINCRKV